jgi:poly-beta-hydroxyalkanoate depolymerase
MLYQADQTQSDLMSPLRLLAQSTSAALWLNKTEGRFLRKLSASMEVFSRMRLTHSRPAYNISTVKVGEQELAVTEETVLTMPFGTLLRFKKEAAGDLPLQPPVLLAATAIMAEAEDDDPVQPSPAAQPAGHQQAHRMVREKPDQPCAPAAYRLHAPCVSRLCAGQRIFGDEPGTP